MPDTLVRYCFIPGCRRPITACNGFVIARDFLAFLTEKLPSREVRELCGVCREKLYGEDEEFLAFVQSLQEEKR